MVIAPTGWIQYSSDAQDAAGLIYMLAGGIAYLTFEVRGLKQLLRSNKVFDKALCNENISDARRRERCEIELACLDELLKEASTPVYFAFGGLLKQKMVDKIELLRIASL